MSIDPPLRIALVGLQHAHINQVISYAQNTKKIQLVAIAEPDETLRKAASDRLSIPAYPALDDLLGNETCDAAALAPINADKTSLAITCIQAGLHVLLDKPAAITWDQLAQLRHAVECNDRILSLMLTLRFTPCYVTARRLIREGAIGPIVHTWMTRPHKLKRPTRPDWMFRRCTYGGIIPDLLVHDIDMFRWVTGATWDDVAHMTAFHGNYRAMQDVDFEDAAHVLLRLHDGTVASLEANWLTPDAAPYHGDCRAIFTGERGVVEVDTLQNKVRLTTSDAGPRDVPLDVSRSVEDDFMCGIREGKDAMTLPPQEALESTAWSLLARAAADRFGRFQRRESAPPRQSG